MVFIPVLHHLSRGLASYAVWTVLYTCLFLHFQHPPLLFHLPAASSLLQQPPFPTSTHSPHFLFASAYSPEIEEDHTSSTKTGVKVIQRPHPALPEGLFDISTIPPQKIAIMQFDSRPLKNYWLSAAQWNAAYCQKHGHRFIYYTTDEACHHGDEPLASAWCKVRAMLNIHEDFPDIDFFIYLDSDAVIDKRFASFSLNQMLEVMQHELSWNPEEKPIIFNQDGPCWWCTFIIKIGYKMCLNAGTVAWYRHPTSLKILQEWWDASMDSYETNPIKRYVFTRFYLTRYREL